MRPKQEKKLHAAFCATLDLPGRLIPSLGRSRNSGVGERGTVRDRHNCCFSSCPRGSAEGSQSLWDLTQDSATSRGAGWEQEFATPALSGAGLCSTSMTSISVSLVTDFYPREAPEEFLGFFCRAAVRLFTVRVFLSTALLWDRQSLHKFCFM